MLIIIRFWRCRIWRLGKRRLSGLSCLSRFARETVFRKVWRIQEAGAARIPPLSSSLNYSTRGGRCCAASCVVGLRRSLRRPCGTLPSVAPPSLPPCPPSTPCIQRRGLRDEKFLTLNASVARAYSDRGCYFICMFL